MIEMRLIRGILDGAGGSAPFNPNSKVTMKLSSHELALLSSAVPFAQEKMGQLGRLPSRDELKQAIHCGSTAASNLLTYFADQEVTKIAKRLERGHEKSTARALVQTAVDKPYQSTSEYLIKENARLHRQIEKQKVELVNERDLRKELALGHAGYDELLENITDFVQKFGDFSSPITRIKVQKPLTHPPVSKDHSEDAVLVISDTHFGDVIRKADTSGFAEFDLTIAGNRFGYIAKHAKQVLSLHRAMYPIKNLYVPILGDIGNGDLHDAPKSNALFVPAQIHFSYHMIRFMIEDLQTLVADGIVENIILLFSVGNHMRMAEDKNMPTKFQAQRTFDWLIYQMVIERFKGTKGIEIHDTMSPFIFESIRGHRYGFNHGMEVGYKNSPEVQAKSMSSFINHTRALFDSPIYRKANNLQGATFDRFVIGDIHVPTSFPRILSNGSLNGQNELGVNWGLEVIPAGQWLFGVSDKRIQTWQYFLDCTDVQRENPNGYATFAADYDAKFGR